MLVLVGRHPSTRAPGAGSPRASATGAAASPSVEPPPDEALDFESLSSLGGVALLQVKRYAASPLGVSARQVRGAASPLTTTTTTTHPAPLPPPVVQVVARPEYLDSNDVFVLLYAARRTLFVWRGTHAPLSLQATPHARPRPPATPRIPRGCNPSHPEAATPRTRAAPH